MDLLKNWFKEYILELFNIEKYCVNMRFDYSLTDFCSMND